MKNIFAFILSCILLFPFVSYAHHDTLPHKNFRYYVGTTVNTTDLNTGVSRPTGNSPINKSVVTFRVFAGVMMAKWLAMEAFYADLGFEDTNLAPNAQVTYRNRILQTGVNASGNINIKSTSMGVGPLISFDLDFSRPFIRFGMQRWSYAITNNNVFPSIAGQSANGFSPYYGGGVDFKVSNEFWLRGEVINYIIDGRTSGQFGLGLLYIF